MTFSAASHYENLPTEKHINWLFALFGYHNHCEKWFWHDVKEAKNMLDKAKEMEKG